MSSTILFMILVIVVGGYLLDYHKSKLEFESKNSKQDEEVGELRKLVQQMKRRIENLEAVAAESPEDFNMNNGNLRDIIEVDEQDTIKKENQKKVADRVKRREM